MSKYNPFNSIPIKNRKWPNNTISKAPIWCSVDLRDGNQALAVPMTIEQKLQFFSLLVKIGFKEIEVGYPAANDTEFAFVRKIIEEKLIPEDIDYSKIPNISSEAREKLEKEKIKASHFIFIVFRSSLPSWLPFCHGYIVTKAI